MTLLCKAEDLSSGDDLVGASQFVLVIDCWIWPIGASQMSWGGQMWPKDSPIDPAGQYSVQ